jgi:predicted HNH restriction endonuclease
MGVGKLVEWPKSQRTQAIAAWLRKRGLMINCERCGYKEVPEILALHHKNRDRTNNTKHNIEILCPNCHTIEHLPEQKSGWKHKRNPKTNDAGLLAGAI